MKYIYIISLASFLTPLFSFAQSNYKPGYVVALKGDTLYGYIDYRDWDTNPNSINFKTAAADNKAKKYTPREISFFKVDGLEAYQKYAGPISQDVTNTDRLANGRDTSFKTDTVFLKVLQKGKKVALFSYSDNLKTRFYIGESPFYTPAELVYRLYYNVDDVTQNKNRTVNENTYVRQLFVLAEKYNVITETLRNNIQNADYKEPDILQIVSKLNGLSEKEFTKNYSESIKSHLFAGAALNIINTFTNPGSPYDATGGKSYTSYQPEVSFGVDVFANPNTGRLLFRMEVSLAESQYRSLYENKVSPYVAVRASFNEVWFSFAPQIIYNFYNAENFKFYAGVGASLTYVKYANTYFGGQDPSTPTSQISDNPYDFSNFDVAVLLKAGVQFNRKWGIFADYLTTTATARGGYFELSKNGEQIGFDYFFGK